MHASACAVRLKRSFVSSQKTLQRNISLAGLGSVSVAEASFWGLHMSREALDCKLKLHHFAQRCFAHCISCCFACQAQKVFRIKFRSTSSEHACLWTASAYMQLAFLLQFVLKLSFACAVCVTTPAHISHSVPVEQSSIGQLSPQDCFAQSLI